MLEKHLLKSGQAKLVATALPFVLFPLLLLLGLFLGAPVQAAGSGAAATSGSVTIPVATNVTCSSAQVTVSPGNQTTTLTVNCTLSGNPTNLGSNANSFVYPATLTNGSQTLSLTPVSTVTSPDNSVTGITGSYSGFNGSLQSGTSNTWKIRSTCTVNTTATTPSGTYTGTVNYNWSTI